MLYTLQNQTLTVQISDTGAELCSVKRGACEYIWYGDPAFWKFHAPIVFPVCGKLQDGKYDYDGKTYEIPSHGFSRPSLFTCISHTDTALCLQLTANDETRAVYPFEFCLKVWYLLDGEKLTTRMEIENTGNTLLPATLGFHPGFNVPLDGGRFEDYYLEFQAPCYPDRMVFSEQILRTGEWRAFLLEGSKILRLRHDLFDNDAIFLQHTAKSVTLKADHTDRAVTLSYSEIPYLGVWHATAKEAPYVCIEPFAGLAGLDGVREDLLTRPNTFRIEPGKVHTVGYDAVFH